MTEPFKIKFAPLSLAEILLESILLLVALMVFAFLLYMIIPGEQVQEEFRILYHQASLCVVAIVSGMLYAKRHERVFLRGEHHYLIVVLLLSFITFYLNRKLVPESLDLDAMLSLYWRELVMMLIPIFLGAWFGGFIGTLLFKKDSSGKSEQ